MAGLLITTEAMVVEVPAKPPAMQSNGSGMGGMGGMGFERAINRSQYKRLRRPNRGLLRMRKEPRRPPTLGALYIDAETDTLAFMGFPKDDRVRIHSTNPLERLNGEIKRPTEVVGILPNEDAITHLVGTQSN